MIIIYLTAVSHVRWREIVGSQNSISLLAPITTHMHDICKGLTILFILITQLITMSTCTYTHMHDNLYRLANCNNSAQGCINEYLLIGCLARNT